MNIEKIFSTLWEEHRGATIGVGAGLLFGVFVAIFGFFKMFFIALCVVFGLFIGKAIDDKVDLRSWVAELVRKVDER